MHADFRVLLDACVMAPHGLCDLFLRLAETPRLYVPCWSARILDEVQRVQTDRLEPPWPKPRSDHWRREVEAAFPEAIVEGYEPLTAVLGNSEGDRHVLAAAIRGDADVIVTFNTRDFPADSLAPWGIAANHPSEYLNVLFSIDPVVFVSKLEQIATCRRQSLEEVVSRLSKTVPTFAQNVASQIGLRLPA
ncbi:MAG: PIN domain-containing protein [Verrucomicrobiales bacterium]|nr:PIN domain-containing protein [Verrucomicrobiales bacterium]